MQELLILVLGERTDLTISLITMSRLLRRHRMRLGRPKPIVGCPWEKSRRDRRLRRIRRLVRDLGPRDDPFERAEPGFLGGFQSGEGARCTRLRGVT
jgi:hypothetical protein